MKEGNVQRRCKGDTETHADVIFFCFGKVHIKKKCGRSRTPEEIEKNEPKLNLLFSGCYALIESCLLRVFMQVSQ